MKRGVQRDLINRFEQAHAERLCVIPESASDARRLRYALKRHDVVSPAPQVYALPRIWDKLKPTERELYRIRSLAKAHPTWAFCDVSAAVVHGLQVPYGLLGRAHIACDRNTHARNTEHYKRHLLPNELFEQVDGVSVTSLERTVFDCTRTYRFASSLAIADSALRTGEITRDDFIRAFSYMHPNCRSRQKAIDTMLLANPLAESGGESIARAAMIRAGYQLPELQVQTDIQLTEQLRYRIDFYWHLPTGDVAGELDGNEKYTNVQMSGGKDIVTILTNERKREALVTSKNLKVMRFSYRDVLDERKFCKLMDLYYIPKGEPIPAVAFT